MTPDVDERDLANFALTIGLASMVLLAILLFVEGDVHAGVYWAMLLGLALVTVGLEFNPRTEYVGGYPLERYAQSAIAVGALSSAGAVLLAGASNGPWDVAAMVLFLGGTLVACGGAFLGLRSKPDESGGASE